MKKMDLIADVGGTNIRLAMLDDGIQSHLECFKCDDFESLETVVAHYLETKQDIIVVDACFGIAGPVHGEVFTMTNLGWTFSVQSLKDSIGFNNVYFINDYTAISMSIPQLGSDDLTPIHNVDGDDDAPRIICGPGTGLGVAQLTKVDGYFECISGEGGHAEFAPNNLRQVKVLEALMDKFDHVAVERLLSGQGIVNIFQALAKVDKIDPPQFDASQISQRFIKQSDPLCVETMELFCDVLAQYLGNMVLTSGAFGGVYIAGGIIPRIINDLDKERFINVYSRKGRFKDYVLKAPIYLITEAQPGLMGASVYLSQKKQKGNI